MPGFWNTAAGGVATDAIYDAKGDLPVGTGANTAARLPVGTNGQVLTADSAEATGTKWATPSSGATFVTRVYQSLTAKTTWSAANTREQWGTEEATLDDALLPSTTGVTVYASARGSTASWTNDSLIRYRVEISLDGGSTWQQGQDNWIRNDASATNDRATLFTDHQYTGTVTGDIQARVMAETDITTGNPNLQFGNIAMEVIV